MQTRRRSHLHQKNVRRVNRSRLFRFEPLEDRRLFAVLEQFDLVTAPSLPAGWTQTTTSTNPWTTVAGANSDTAPNHAFVANLSVVSDSRLISSSFVLSPTTPRLSFRNFYNTEQNWDGGVLEIAINDGAFNDILVAGGSFTAGGYLGPLNSSGNPLANRAAWHGNSGGYITTEVNLPATAFNQNVVLRWRLGSDESVNATGWRIDTISLNSLPTDDYGDAPLPYPVTLAENGARHTPGALFLGATVDVESDGIHSAGATGDGSDEDGVVIANTLFAGGSTNVQVTASQSGGLLNGWIDWNADGDWTDAGEQVSVNQPLVAGLNTLVLNVPGNAATGATFARFRLSTTSGLGVTGPASNGEVEDYVVSLVTPGAWADQGPAGTINGQLEPNTQPNRRITGAIHTVLAHPTNPDILYIGGVNGGIWKTTNATATLPTWVPQTDFLNSLAIGALSFDPTDATRNTLVAGTAKYSSFASFGGTRGAVYRTTDGGTTWTSPASTGITGENISGIAARGNTIVVTSSSNSGGVFRSTNGGASFTPISAADFTSPLHDFTDLIHDPTDPTSQRLYAASVGVGGSAGIYRSDNFGLNWTKISGPTINSAMHNLIVSSNNIEMAVHPTTGRLYVATLVSGQPRGVFHVANPTAATPTWTQMDIPILPVAAGVSIAAASNTSPIQITSNSHNLQSGNFVIVSGATGNTAANGFFRITRIDANTFSLDTSSGNGTYTGGGTWTRVTTPNPNPKDIDKAGGQGRIHFSIVVDPTDDNIIYIGGDRQEQPNLIGDNVFGGAVFRGNASIARNPNVVPSPQWDHITHDIVGFDPPAGTANGTSPHADSRELTFDANGNLIETDDGGIYRRTSPRNNTGDWFSVAGNLGVIEFHDIAYDSLSNVLIGGTQDNGTHFQVTPGGKEWDFLSGGDGGDVAVDNVTLAASNQSIRYSSSQNLGGFRRSVWGASNNLVSNTFPVLTLLSGAAFSPSFKTPVELNAVDPQRILIIGNNGIYESTNSGSSITQVSTAPLGFLQDAVDYGGFLNGVPNLGVFYAGMRDDIVFRTATGGVVSTVDPDPASFGDILDVVMNSDNWMTAYAVDGNQVFRTTNSGVSWTDITGNLMSLAGESLQSIEFIPGPIGALVVGGNLGVFTSPLTTLGTWTEVGSALPNVLVYDLKYNAADDVLVAGTLGRGAWTLPSASALLGGESIPPTITSIIAFGSAWIQPFIDGVDGGGIGGGNGRGYELTPGQSLPNSGIDRIHIQFSEPVTGFNAANLALLGVNTPDYELVSGLVTVSYDSANNRGVVSFSTSIGNDKLRVGVSDAVKDTSMNALDGNADSTAGGVFDFRFNMLIGDGDNDGNVNGGDLGTFGAAFNQSVGGLLYNARADWNSDGSINGADLGPFAANFNQSLPINDPGPLNFGPGPSPAALFAPVIDELDKAFSQWSDNDDVRLLEDQVLI